ncbi:hypothetical protein [Sutcliffiella halmapala]|uniref:hypothetical protein n=1 Tax=Sutcliffiella halmapala TaxID=79882 RepID=UPI0009956B5C|nr:hypothetical protein [Sutcliffiella halmapala]
MNYLKYLLIIVLCVSGAITWFTVLSSPQFKQNESLIIQAHRAREGDWKEPLTVPSVQHSITNANIREGLSEKHVAELNLVNYRVAIDDLLTYIESKEREE